MADRTAVSVGRCTLHTFVSSLCMALRGRRAEPQARSSLMRTLFPLALLALFLGACRCGPETPTPVTVRIKNSGRSPLWVDASDERMGVEIQRNVGNEQWFGFIEKPTCECQRCENVCGGCECAPPPPRVMRINAGQTMERTWDGIVQVDGNGACGLLGGGPCVNAEIPAIDETFRARFCYALSVPITVQGDAGVAVTGRLPEGGVACTTRDFKVRDLLVEVSPERGAACTTHSECKGKDELCLDAQCTTACPANDIPQLGSGWQFSVDEPLDEGFFSVTQDGDFETYTGSGTVTSVRYDNSVMTLRLSRPNAGGGVLRGTVYVQLPGSHAVAFNVNEAVSVKLVDRSEADNFGQRGIVIRDAAGVLLLAADTAQKERALTDADLSPFTVDTEGEVAGCAPTDCGKQLQSKTGFGHGTASSVVTPGDAPRVVVGASVFKLLNAANARYTSTVCPLEKLTPYAILNTRETP